MTPFNESVSWHPDKEAVALSMLQSRRAPTIWIWQHRFSLRKLQAFRAYKVAAP
jgi:hypothetical protein